MSEHNAVHESQQLSDAVISDAPPPALAGSKQQVSVPGQAQPSAAVEVQYTPHGSDGVSQEPGRTRVSLESMAPMVAEQAKRLNEVWI